MSKVVSVENGNYTIKSESGGQIILDTARGSFTDGLPSGTVVVRGSLEVEGTTTTVESNDTLINDNILTLNNGQQGAGISASKNYQSGIEIDRGSEPTARFVFDDSVSWDIGGDSGTGGFKIYTGSTGKAPLVVDGIKSNAALFIDTGNNAISVTNATNYEESVFQYAGGVMTGGPLDDDLIPNAKAVVDYVAFSSSTDLQDRIEEGTDATKTFVEARDFEITNNPSVIIAGVETDLNNAQVYIFADRTHIEDIRISDNKISTTSSNENLILEAAGTGGIQVNDNLQITETPAIDDLLVDPVKPAEGILLYSKTQANGGSGLYFVNKSDTRDELVSNNRSLLYGMLF